MRHVMVPMLVAALLGLPIVASPGVAADHRREASGTAQLRIGMHLDEVRQSGHLFKTDPLQDPAICAVYEVAYPNLKIVVREMLVASMLANDPGKDDGCDAPQMSPTMPLTTDGMDPLNLGLDFEMLLALWPGPVERVHSAGGGKCEEYQLDDGGGFRVLLEEGKLARVTGSDPKFGTPQGVSVGDEEATVLKVYGDRVAHGPDNATAKDLIVWLAEGRGYRFEIGPDHRVAVIHAGQMAISNRAGCL